MRMRVINGVLALVFGVFTVAQLNDPDAALWILFYGLGTFWTLLAALVPGVLALRPISMMLSLTVAGLILACMYYWPDVPGWWRTEVWWETETAREGIGLLALVLGLIAPVMTSIGVSRARKRAELAEKEALIERRRETALAGARHGD